jgi:hypothetical protein
MIRHAAIAAAPMSFRKTRPFPQIDLAAVYAIPAMENSRWLNGLSGSELSRMNRLKLGVP